MFQAGYYLGCPPASSAASLGDYGPRFASKRKPLGRVVGLRLGSRVQG